MTQNLRNRICMLRVVPIKTFLQFFSGALRRANFRTYFQVLDLSWTESKVILHMDISYKVTDKQNILIISSFA